MCLLPALLSRAGGRGRIALRREPGYAARLDRDGDGVACES
ncbi:MAG TPA: excalibur calcium-binding domain-containing protein [Pseudonocardiaceae bacterium]|nr:excalibur calcium-binding domain-containing protein [Pseudonocardiaceae bacterium]